MHLASDARLALRYRVTGLDRHQVATLEEERFDLGVGEVLLVFAVRNSHQHSRATHSGGATLQRGVERRAGPRGQALLAVSPQV